MAARLLPLILLVLSIFLIGKYGYELVNHVNKHRTRGDWVIVVFISIVVLIAIMSRINQT